MQLNSVLKWKGPREKSSGKMSNLNIVQGCMEISKSWSIQYGETVAFEGYEGSENYHFMGGFGSFKHIKFSKGLYINNFPERDDWENALPDDAVYKRYISNANDRYPQTVRPWQKERPYVLFPMQMIYPKDYYQTIAAVKWATENKIYTVFKRHPASYDGDLLVGDCDKFWNVMGRMGYLSKYTVLPYGHYNSISMVSQCDMLFSADSAMTLQAMLLDKPTFTMRRCQISDIIPVIDLNKLDDTVLSIKAVPVPTQVKWLSWYWNVCVNDFDALGFSNKIRKRHSLYRDGHSDLELNSWEFTKKNGLHI